MRLSDAIATGRVAVSPRSGVVLDADGSGCALGMAGVASGIFCIGQSAEHTFDRLETAFPWAIGTEVLTYPCTCNLLPGYKVTGIVGHLFDRHVMVKKDWTLDQLIDWVRSVEPVEATPSPTEGASSLAVAHTELVAKEK